MTEILPVLADPAIPDEEVGGLLRTQMRKFTPDVLAVIVFQGGPGTADLMEAVPILRGLNRVGGQMSGSGRPSPTLAAARPNSMRLPGTTGVEPESDLTFAALHQVQWLARRWTCAAYPRP